MVWRTSVEILNDEGDYRNQPES